MNQPNSGTSHSAASSFEEDDFWTVSGSPIFNYFPGGVVSWLPKAVPIVLTYGDPDRDHGYGESHIRGKHGTNMWRSAQKHPQYRKHTAALTDFTAPCFLWLKLQESGPVYETTDRNKMEVLLTVSPSLIVILKFIRARGVLSITTSFPSPEQKGSKRLGRYSGLKAGYAPELGHTPHFELICHKTGLAYPTSPKSSDDPLKFSSPSGPTTESAQSQIQFKPHRPTEAPTDTPAEAIARRPGILRLNRASADNDSEIQAEVPTSDPKA